MFFLGIDLFKLRNAEFLQFSKDFLSIVSLNDASLLQVLPQYQAFEADVAEISALFITDQGNDTTPLIQDADLRRDTAISGITLFANAMVYHFDPAVRAAATKVADNLALYGGGIARQNLMAETASISNIIADWNSKPELSNAITTLNLWTWKAELEAANNQFNTLYIARTQQLGAVSPDTVRGKRLEAYTTYYALRDRIAAFATINNNANPWGKTINEGNALIEQYNVLLAGRTGSSEEEAPAPVV
ncbi:MAG: DUF6261 family protein [Chitinophagaceae bacterium]|jgi:hypothetical protein